MTRPVQPHRPRLGFFVARGEVDLEGAGVLHEGDAVRLTGVGGKKLTAVGDAEVLIWQMHAAVER